jgi:hypothetical protein
MKLEMIRASITNRLKIIAVERYIMPEGIRKSALKKQKPRNKTVPPIKEIKVVFFPILMIKSSVFSILKVLCISK